MRLTIETIRAKLVGAMRASGYTIEDSDDRLAAITGKLNSLEKTGRFGRLLSALTLTAKTSSAT